MSYKILLLYLFLLKFLFPTFAYSQCWPKADKLVPNTSFNNDEGFGVSVDYENNIAAVGATASDTLELGSGIVYVFQFDGSSWNKIADLTPSDYHQYQNFGQTVKIKGDFIYVADPSHMDGTKRTGQIYIFKKPAGGWRDMIETSTLVSTDPNALAFGTSLDIFEDTMIVGAPSSVDNNNNGVGAAYIFQQQGDVWNQIAKFSSSYSLPSIFGSHVAIRKNLAVVVAEEESDQLSTRQGSSYVFEKDAAAAWANALPVARLTNVSQDPSVSYLGYGLAIDETRQTVFIGTNAYDQNNNFSKGVGVRAYIKPSDGWQDMTENAFYINTELTSVYYEYLQFEEPYLYFAGGESVKILMPDNTNSWSTLTPSGSLRSSDYSLAQRYGSAISVRNGHVIVGAPARNTLDRDHLVAPCYPAVYEFVMPTTGWTNLIYTENHKFTYMPKTASSFEFGYAIDMDGNYAVVGSPNDDDGGRQSGVVYVYHLEGLVWKKIAKLSPSDGEPYDFFGGSVAISKNYIAISAVNKNYRDATGKVVDFNLGAVYIFEKQSGEWSDMTETFKIIKSDGDYDTSDNDREDDDFGVTVDMDFPYLIVAKFDQGSRPNTGSVYVYNLTDNKPTLEATLNPSTRDNVNNFGTTIKITNNTIAISSGGLRFWFGELNRVFIYTKSGDKWTDSFESAILYPSDDAAHGYLGGIAFGVGLDMNATATKIIVGAPGWYDGVIFQTQDYFKGAAYIFEKPAGGWKNNLTEKVRLTVPGQPAYGCMGVSVHIEDRYAAVGSPQNYFYTYGGSNEGSGRVYFYQMPDSGWSEKVPDKIITGDEAGNTESDYFGASIDGVFGFMMIGAIADDNQKSVDAGSVYIYTEYPFIYPSQSPVCQNEKPVQLVAYPTGGQWSGGGIKNSSDGIFDPTLARKGVFIIHYKVDDCDASNTLIMQVDEMLKEFSISSNDSIFFCGASNITIAAPVKDSVTYQWSYKADSTYSLISNAILPTLETKNMGFYKVTMSNICSSQDGYVWAGNLYPNAGNGFKTCLTSDSISLHGNYPTGTWSGDGISANGNFVLSKAGLGKHILNYTVSPYAGCSYKDTLQVNVNGITTLNVTSQGEDSFCYTGTTKLTATKQDNVVYNWYYGESESTLSQLSESSNSLDASNLGLYKVVAFAGLCSKDALHQISPIFNPTVSPADDSLSFCHDASIKIEAQEIVGAKYTLLKNDGDNTQVVDQTNDSFTSEISDSGKYVLKITSHGCEFSSHELTLHKIQPDSVFIPNVITPNGDNLNDTFKIYASDNIDTYSLLVVNRYGKEVFAYSGNNWSTGWSGADLSPGVYFLSFSYFDNCANKTRVINGPLTILK